VGKAYDATRVAHRTRPALSLFCLLYTSRGCALRDVGCPDEAIASHDRAIALRPGYAEAYNERGHALHDLNRHAEALVSYDHAIALKPDYAEAYSNRGVALRSLKRHEEAVASQERAIALKSDYAEAYWNQSLCLLQMGRFELGWRRYEWRKRKAEWRAIFANPQPLWLGEEDIAGKTIFLHYEQGFGDTILSCRYAKLVEARGANVIMEVQPRLHKLLKQISPTIQVTTPDNRPAAYDYHCPLMSLPLAFRTTLATIPSEPRYLQADAASRAIWSARLPARKKSRIGMVWSGSSNYTADRTRSIELATLLPLFGVDADWVCLQKELNHNDADVLRAGGIAFYGDEQNDFSDAAALIDQMDLVIAVDTAVAHLAAAMGKPTWILLSYNPDWRWLLDRDDSPWYPGVKLFRQRRPGDWTGVIDQIIARLNFSFRAN